VKDEVVLGYSGLDGSAGYLAHLGVAVGAERRIFQGMDSAAAVFVNGVLRAAVQQERFSGVKFDHQFPADAIRWCLSEAAVGPQDVDAVAHGFAYGPYERLYSASERSAQRYRAVYSPQSQQSLLQRFFPAIADRVTVQGVRHHVAHALSAAAASGFSECLAIVLDGMGETDAVSVFSWADGRLTRRMALDFRSSLGLFYSLITMHLGFSPNSDEYQVMALAAYGDQARYAALMRDAVRLGPGGRLSVPLLRSSPADEHRELYRAGRRWLADQTFPAVAGDAGSDPRHADLAAAAQRRLEEAISHVVMHWVRETGLRRVALAGGVALNCVANGMLLRHDVESLYVQPAAGDEGTALGGAIHVLARRPASISIPPMPFWGPEIEDAPDRAAGWIRLPSGPSAVAAASQLLAAGAIVGWAQDRLEFGPRALGNRSILADPRSESMRDRVNSAVKFRQEFRPLAPAVLAEHADEYFEIPAGADLRHMTVAVPVRKARRHLIPAVVHLDGTARVQVVHRLSAPRFWSLLKSFHDRTGVPVLLNTSLNVRGQPIARSRADAVRVFDSSALDALVIGNNVLLRPAWRALLPR